MLAILRIIMHSGYIHSVLFVYFYFNA